MKGVRAMKKEGILHPELSYMIASLGHGDRFCISDAGLPIPPQVNRIDLAYVPGSPPFFSVLDVILKEIAVEEVFWAMEVSKDPSLAGKFEKRFRDMKCSSVTHEDFKKMLPEMRFIVRTGEYTPFSNIILSCGVPF
jgi:D-ribose pyranase